MRSILIAPLVLLAVAAAACESTNTLTSTDIVFEIPWEVPETNRYRVLDDEDEEAGTLEMSIEDAGGGSLRLTQDFDFPEAGFINEAIVIVDAETLQPTTTSFRIDGPDGELTCDAGYTEAEVEVRRVGEDDSRTDQVDVPTIAYDSWADLFVWRTINFGPAYEISYTDVLACTLDRTQRIRVGLDVTDENAEVTVPAGTFEAWELEIDSGGETQRAWFAKDNARTLLKYDNGSTTFELLPPAE